MYKSLRNVKFKKPKKKKKELKYVHFFYSIFFYGLKIILYVIGCYLYFMAKLYLIL